MWDHYKRLPIRVEPIDRGDAVFEVETYYGHRSYGLKLLFFNYVLFVCNYAVFTVMYIYKTRGRVSARFARVVRVPGRPGFAGPTLRRVFT